MSFHTSNDANHIFDKRFFLSATYTTRLPPSLCCLNKVKIADGDSRNAFNSEIVLSIPSLLLVVSSSFVGTVGRQHCCLVEECDGDRE